MICKSELYVFSILRIHLGFDSTFEIPTNNSKLLLIPHHNPTPPPPVNPAEGFELSQSRHTACWHSLQDENKCWCQIGKPCAACLKATCHIKNNYSIKIFSSLWLQTICREDGNGKLWDLEINVPCVPTVPGD